MTMTPRVTYRYCNEGGVRMNECGYHHHRYLCHLSAPDNVVSVVDRDNYKYQQALSTVVRQL